MEKINPENTLVVQTGKIGDMILTTPLFSGLKNLFPGTRLKVLASPVNKDIALNHSSVDEVIIFSKNIFKNLPLINSLYKKSDLWIDTKDNYSSTGYLLANFFKPAYSIGFKFENNKTAFHDFLNDYVNGSHAVDINISPLNFFGVKSGKSDIRPYYEIPDIVVNKFKDFFADKYHRNILINVSAGNQSRYLPEETWLRILNYLKNGKEVFNVFITGLEKDYELISNIILKSGIEKIVYIKTKSIIETSEVVRNSDFIITPDTSVVHICSAFNKNVVAVYPDVKWNTDKFRPLSDNNEIVFSDDKNSISDTKPEKIIDAFVRLAGRVN